ncbi:MAG: PIN domain-containing protein [Tepidisphaeraceae bacterium]
MTYLVDANVLSEATKPRPVARVVDWLRANEREIVLDPIVLGEIRFGIYLMPAGARRRQLERWFARGIEKIHCLPWQAATGLRWAKLLAELRSAGRAMPIKDSLIAATALIHNLIIATHNQRDFMWAGVKIIDPFAGA